MGLTDFLKNLGLLNDEYDVGNGLELRARDLPNLELARRFVRFNSTTGYNPWHFLFGPPKSKLYSIEEIAQILLNKENISDNYEGLSELLAANELIEQGFINFRYASRGSAVGVKVVPYKNLQSDVKYRFEVICE